MIRVQKGAEPTILHNNKVQWTQDLQQVLATAGDYDKLTKADKKQYVYHYQHDDIHTALKNGALAERCIYCECDINHGDPNVEHYHPKSLYPGETFEWDNLFSSCVRCNRPKGSFDTANEPFIHPVNEDPEEYLTYTMITIDCRYRAGLNHDKGWNVIEKCDLRRGELYPVLSDKLLEVSKAGLELLSLIDDYNRYKQKSKKISVAQLLLSKLNGLKQMSSSSHEHAGFIRESLRQNPYVRTTVAIVDSHAAALGLAVSFDWGWNYNLPQYI